MDYKIKKFAVLIDGDNAQPTIIENILNEIASLGNAVIKRIYGDFTSPQNASWKKFLQDNAIKPIQQFAYTKGKNATDSALIIDAMDLLYNNKLDGYCLVSSDSDFTGLAIRLRESALTVIGFGSVQTPAPFQKACNQFIITNIFKEKTAKEKEKTKPKPTLLREEQLIKMIVSFINNQKDKKWAAMSEIGSMLKQTIPEFKT
ncbi:NYN domain-containing protein [Mixta tenebrionis]|uniref:NYN domain-containing protein n=1 Tax=Mixta tenebrionis TaxID=2562439 RepID=A0A506VAE2_9GAMM|nr:NYN domain-containing protein [Mixta tenebrionis]TPW42655.1 NYN domain-containing protein [Mixta tenebrionis]